MTAVLELDLDSLAALEQREADLVAFLEECGLEGNSQLSLVTAAHEIFTNVFEHSRSPNGAKVTVTISDDVVLIVVDDTGSEFTGQLADTPEADIGDPSGRGLSMTAALVDDLSYERVDGHNQWTLLMRTAAA